MYRQLNTFIFRYFYLFFKYLQAAISVLAPLVIWFFLIALGYLVFTSSDQFTDLVISMLFDWWYSLSAQAKWARIGRDGSFLFSLTIWAFSIAFGSRWILLRTPIKPILLRPKFEFLRQRLERFQYILLLYTPRLLSFLPFALLALVFYKTTVLTNYIYKNSWYWILVLLSLGILTSGGILTFIHRQLAGANQQSPYRKAITSRQAHGVQEFPLFRKWVIGLAVLHLALTFFLGFLHRLIEWAAGDELPTRFDLATLVGFGTIFIAALSGWGMLLVWLRFQLHKRSLSLVLFLVGFALLVYSLGINIQRREIRTLDLPLNRQADTTYVEEWLLNRQQDIGNTIPVFIVAAEGGGSRAAQWTAGVLARLDAELPGFRKQLLAISSVSGSSVGASFYISWLYAHPQSTTLLTPPTTIRSDLDTLTSADFLSGLAGAFCYPDPMTSFIPLIWRYPVFDRARWLEDRFADHYFYKTGDTTLTQGINALANEYRLTAPLLFLNSTVVETGKKAIITPLRLSSRFFYDSRDVLTEIQKDIPLKTAMGLSSRFPVVTPAGTVYGKNPDSLSYRLADGGYFENTGIQTAYQLLQLVLDRQKVLRKQKRLTKLVQPIILFISNGNSQLTDNLQATTGFAPISAFYKAWANRKPSIIGDMTYFVQQSDSIADFQYFQLAKPKKLVLPLGWYLSQPARVGINNQVEGINTDKFNQRAYTTLKNLLAPFNPPAQKSRPPAKSVSEPVQY